MSLPALVLSLLLSAAVADSPPPEPRPYEIESPRHRFVAAVAPTDGAVWSTRVYELPARKFRWSLTGGNLVALADDGDHWASEYGGANLLAPGDDRPDTVVAIIHEREKVLRRIRLGEVEPMTRLKPTISHKHWGSVGDFVPGTTTLEIHDADGHIARFAVKPELDRR